MAFVLGTVQKSLRQRLPSLKLTKNLQYTIWYIKFFSLLVVSIEGTSINVSKSHIVSEKY